MSRQKKKFKLKDEDWKDLFPGSEFEIGTTKILIEPLSVQQLAFILGKLNSVSESLAEVAVSAEDFGTNSARIINLVRVIIEEVPEVLSEMSGLDVEDIKNLPLTVAVELFNKCLDVNIESQESLVANLKELATKFGQFVASETTPETTAAEMTPIKKALKASLTH